MTPKPKYNPRWLRASEIRASRGQEFNTATAQPALPQTNTNLAPKSRQSGLHFFDVFLGLVVWGRGGSRGHLGKGVCDFAGRFAEGT